MKRTRAYGALSASAILLCLASPALAAPITFQTTGDPANQTSVSTTNPLPVNVVSGGSTATATTSAPTYTDSTSNPLSLTTSGSLRTYDATVAQTAGNGTVQMTPQDGVSLDSATVGGSRGNLIQNSCTAGTSLAYVTFTCTAGQKFAYVATGYKSLDISTGTTSAAATIVQQCSNTSGTYLATGTSWNPSTSGDAKTFTNGPGVFCQVSVTVLSSGSIVITPSLRAF